MILLEVLQSTTAYFQKRGVESARLNAEHLLAHVLGEKRIELYLQFERVLQEEELVPLRELVRRRGQGEPLQHLLGTVEFCGKIFICDGRALVPRPETEELVGFVQEMVGKEPARLADIGTGSGVIALSLASYFPQARVVGVDISDGALALARENAERLGLNGRIQFMQSNLLKSLNESFEAIVANLPYIARPERATLSREVLHDPDVALFGGETGQEVIRELIEQGPDRLAAGGLLALEVGAGQADSLSAFLKDKNYHDIESKSDYSGTPRFLFARYG